MGPFRGECHVAGKSFIDAGQYSKKIQAKEAIAKITVMELMQDFKVKECLQNKQAYKIDPKELQQQFLRHFQQGSSSTLEYSTRTNKRIEEQSNRENMGVKNAERSHFTFPSEKNQSYMEELEIPLPNFDDLADREHKKDSFRNYQMAPHGDALLNHSSYYNGSNMWYTQPAIDSSHASPFGYIPSNSVKPEQPDLVVVFDRNSEGKNDMDRRHDLEGVSNWSSRSERHINHRAGQTFTFPPSRGRPRMRGKGRSLSRPPSSRSRSRSSSRSSRRRRHSRGRSQSVDRTPRDLARKRRKSSPRPPSFVPANVGKYGTLIFEMTIENPNLGTPHFSTRPSPFIVHEVIAQLAIGSKVFLSATSHAKEIDAIEDVSKIAHEELHRMLEINKKMIHYKNNANRSVGGNVGENAAELDNIFGSSIMKENQSPEVSKVKILKQLSKNVSEQPVFLNNVNIKPSKDAVISIEEDILYYDDNQNELDFIRLEPARRSFTEKFKRVEDLNKRSQIDAIVKKREALNNDISKNIPRVAVSKVKGEYSDED